MKTKYNEFTEIIKQRSKELDNTRKVFKNMLRNDITEFLKTKGFEVDEKWEDVPVSVYNKETKIKIDFRYIYSTNVLFGIYLYENYRYLYSSYPPVSWYYNTKELETFYEEKIVYVMNFISKLNHGTIK